MEHHSRKIKSIQNQLADAGLLQLPIPEESEHDSHYKLCERIRQLIEQSNGILPFDKYMQAALYEPGLGYYVSATRKFGEQGDFITAPEVSSVFGQCLAIQCEEIFSEFKQNNQTFDLLEIGPGNGKLALDLMTALDKLDCLPEHYYFLETSPDLQQRQKQLVENEFPDCLSRFHWLSHLPEHFSGVIVANELLDAMPVKRFHFEKQKLMEWGVCFQNGGFQYKLMDVDPELSSFVHEIESSIQAKMSGEHATSTYSSEINLWLKPWMKSIAGCLDRGVLLLIDYGYTATEYYHEQRNDGTLICNYRHHAHDNPFILVGLQDISAFVDFSAVAAHATGFGLNIAGYCPQAHFLIQTGLDEIAQEKLSKEPEGYLKMAQEIKHLTLPGEMGERFKVIGFSKNLVNKLRGFEKFDQTHRL